MPTKITEESKYSIEEEKLWLQSGVAALKNAKKNGYSCAADELKLRFSTLRKQTRRQDISYAV